jgi:hypothetical protein
VSKIENGGVAGAEHTTTLPLDVGSGGGNLNESVNNVEMLDESATSKQGAAVVVAGSVAEKPAVGGSIAPQAKIPDSYNKPVSKYKRQIYTNAVNFRVNFQFHHLKTLKKKL